MRRYLIFFLIFSVSLMATLEEATAVKLTLKRIVFEGSKRAEVLTVINSNTEPKTYRIGWKHFKMTPDKTLVAVTEDEFGNDVKPVTEMVRFSPRRFVVPPRSSQQIRMMLRTPSGLPDGEYRSHLWIHEEEDPEQLRAETAKRPGQPKNTGSVKLKMLAGVTMPVIVRKGNLTSKVSISNLSATATGGFINTSFSILREGDKSDYGALDLVCNSGQGEYVLRTIGGTSVYPEVNQRNFKLRIEKRFDRPACNSLKVMYIQTSGDGVRSEGRNALLAESLTQVKQ